jgi:hypothetical protein
VEVVFSSGLTVLSVAKLNSTGLPLFASEEAKVIHFSFQQQLDDSLMVDITLGDNHINSFLS